MKRINLFTVLAISFGLTTLVSCNGNLNIGTNAALSTTATDEAQVASINDEVLSSVDQYAQEFENSNYQKVSGAQKVKSATAADTVIVSVDNSEAGVFPKVITLDFGDGFTGRRGNVLKGKIIVTISGRMALAGSVRTITFEDFYVNDNKVEGIKTVTNNGLNDESQPSMTVTANDTITRTDGKIVTWNSNRTRTRTDNNGTPLVYWDDTFTITGSSNGVNARGVAYSMTIDDTNPLVMVGGWPFFVKGTVIMESESRTAVMDYGDGTKDRIATLTINGVTKEITLRR